MPERMVREPERRQITGRSRSQWYDDEQAGRVPRRRRLGPRACGWLLSELLAWVNDPAGWAAQHR